MSANLELPENLSMPENPLDTSEDKLSKRQLKRLKKKELWKAKLPAKRANEKLKMKMKRKAAKLNNIKLGPSRKQLKNAKMANSKCKIRLALDFSFDNLMIDKDIAKCIGQVQRCYCSNRRAEEPLQFYVVNLNGKSKERMGKVTGYKNWDVNIHQDGYLHLFPKEELVYLSSESDNVIETLEENKVYIIGALVDHNSQKGHCLSIAIEQGIQHARLPIEKYLHMKSRKVLAINHVFDIMLSVSSGLDWKEAMLKFLPQRKRAVARSHNDDIPQTDSATLESSIML